MDIRAALTYTRLRQIGAGQGMNSEVYLANDPQLGGEIVVKEIEKATFSFVAEFFQEAQVMFAGNHDNVVRIHYACETADKICLAMPHFAMGSLADRLALGPLRPREVIRVGDGILRGLAKIHINKFLHLDMKPSNVLFSDSNVPMVADFGQSRAIGPHGVCVPGAMYFNAMPPELLPNSRAATVEADIYQAGLTLYRMVNGDEYYETQRPSAHSIMTAIITGRFPDRNAFLPHVPRAMRAVIRKTLSLNPADRYHSATALADALGKIQIPMDWDVFLAPSGEIRWRAQPDGRTQVVVDLKANASKWNVEINTCSNAKMRAAKKALWATGLTRQKAMDHLKKVLVHLG